MKVNLPKPLAEMGRDFSPLASQVGDTRLCWLSYVALEFGIFESMLRSGQGKMMAPEGQERCSDVRWSVLKGQ